MEFAVLILTCFKGFGFTGFTLIQKLEFLDKSNGSQIPYHLKERKAHNCGEFGEGQNDLWMNESNVRFTFSVVRGDISFYINCLVNEISEKKKYPN